MIRRLAWLALLVWTFSACSSDDTDNTTEDTTVADVHEDLASPDSTDEDQTETPDSQAELPGDDLEDDVDDWVKGCVDDFCAAGPDSAPDPAQPGPFPVGVSRFHFYSKGSYDQNRKIVVEVWYPATEETREMDYDPVDLLDGAPQALIDKIGTDAIDPIPAMHVRDADFRTKDGPYPMVLFSHGAYGIRFQNVFYTTILASHGYVVVSPDHPDNTLYDILLDGYDMDVVVESAFDRPLDVYALLDEMIRRNDTEGNFFHQSFDPELIGISGHSFGGFTSVLCPYEDDRIKVSVPITPSTYAIPVLGHKFEEFPIPIMMMTGREDRTLETDVEMAPVWEQMPTPKHYFEFVTGGHYTYTDICSLDLLKLAEEINFGDAEDALSDGCGENNVDVEIAHPLINQFAIGFLNYHLRDSTGSAQYFSAEAAAPYEDILLYKTEME